MRCVFRGAASLLAALALARAGAADSPPAFLTRPPAPAVTAADVAPPPGVSLPKRPMLEPLKRPTAAPSIAPAAAWPAAFRTGQEPIAATVRPATLVEAPAVATVAAPVDDDPVTTADLKRRVETLYASEAADVGVETEPDGTVRVRVHLRGAARDADRPRKVVDLPQPGTPGVQVLLEVDR